MSRSLREIIDGGPEGHFLVEGFPVLWEGRQWLAQAILVNTAVLCDPTGERLREVVRLDRIVPAVDEHQLVWLLPKRPANKYRGESTARGRFASQQTQSRRRNREQ